MLIASLIAIETSPTEDFVQKKENQYNFKIMEGNKYIPLIVDELLKASPERIILFGSYAYGTPNNDSDLDILVVTQDEFVPTTNKEKMQIHHKYNPLIKEFRKFIPIDLIVYTKTMFDKFKETKSQFSLEITQKGKILYEAIN